MTKVQKEIFEMIQRAKQNGNTQAVRSLARELARYDDRSDLLKKSMTFQDQRPGSRSPHFGKWQRDDE